MSAAANTSLAASVGDGDAEGVAGEIVKGGLLSLAPWRDVNDPGDLPDMGRKVGVRAEPGEGVAEAGAGAGATASVLMATLAHRRRRQQISDR
jgi:hypothetical protein